MRRWSLLVPWIGALLCVLLLPLAARGQAFDYQACLQGRYYASANFPQVRAGGRCDDPNSPTFEEFCAENLGVGVTACLPMGRTPIRCSCEGCGDGRLGGNEQCDDGNRIDGDGCDRGCTLTACGNGITSPGEDCDDGNQIDGDGCDSNCTVTACGNGVLALDASGGIEECDDGNTDNGDGCDSNCTFTVCGNGITTPGEDCDDANDVSSDACVECLRAFCGDGHLRIGIEVCDDGNQIDGDGCNGLCGLPSCGNGRVDGDEECDDGNRIDGDDCRNNCLRGCVGDNCVCSLLSAVTPKFRFNASFPKEDARKYSLPLPFLGKVFEGGFAADANLEIQFPNCTNDCTGTGSLKLGGSFNASLFTESVSGSITGGGEGRVEYCKVCNKELCSQQCEELKCWSLAGSAEGKVGFSRTFPLFPEKLLTWGPIKGRIGCSAKLGCEISAGVNGCKSQPGGAFNCPDCIPGYGYGGFLSLTGLGSLGCMMGLRYRSLESSAELVGSAQATGSIGYDFASGSGCGRERSCAYGSISVTASAAGNACVNLGFFNAKAACEVTYQGYRATSECAVSPGPPPNPLTYACSVGLTRPDDCSKKCEFICRRGTACGDRCIAANERCREPPGKACQGPPPEIQR